MSKPPKYDCQTCGACCCIGLDVVLTDLEAEQFEADPHLVALTVLHPRIAAPPLRLMRKIDDCRCAALAGPPSNCRCTIYAQRPGLCRDFAAGSPDCLDARRRAGYQD